MADLYTGADFVRLALSRFPELQDDFEYNADLLHLQMGDFARLTTKAKGEGNWDKYHACVQFADDLWKRSDNYLRNALGVAYLEHLQFDGPNGKAAWDSLPPTLKKAWKNVHGYPDDLTFPKRLK